MTLSDSMRIRIGTSGWSYAEWRPGFYPAALPQAKWLTHYATVFNTVEVNSTFYGLPKASTFQSWTVQTPLGFSLALKAPRALTHEREANALHALAEFCDRSRVLGERLGPLLYQLPPWRMRDLDYLTAFLERLPSNHVHVIEFRHASWYTPDTRNLLDKAGIGFCQHDMAGSATPEWVTGLVAYQRLHGPTPAKYRGRYGMDKLRALADRISQQAREVEQSLVFFNNTVGGDAAADALDLRGLLNS